MSLYLPLLSFDPVANLALYAVIIAKAIIPVVPQVQVGAIFYT